MWVACDGDRPGGASGRALPEWHYAEEVEFSPPPGREFVLVSAAVLGRDAVIVADGGGPDILVFGQDGRFRRTIGRRGEGPGEYLSVAGAWIREDTVIVFDRDGRQLHRFRLSGEYVRSDRIRAPDGYAVQYPVGMLGPSCEVHVASSFFPAPPGPVVRREVRPVLRVCGADRDRDSMTSYASSATYSEPFGKAGALNAPLPLGGVGAIAVVGNDVALLSSVDDTVRIIHQDGSVSTALGWEPQEARRVIDATDRQKLKAVFTEGGNGSFDLEALFDRMPLGTHVAPYGWVNGASRIAMVGTRGDELWLRTSNGLADSTVVWQVLRSGRREAQVELPARFDVMDAIGDAVLVLERTEDGVPRLYLIRVRK